jgi:hypothetical protein
MLCVSHFLFCTLAEHTLLMENTGAPTAGMASSSGQNIPKVISSFLRHYFFVFFFVLYIIFFTDYSVGLCFFPGKEDEG